MLAATDRLRRSDEFAATIRTGGRSSRGSLVVHLTAPKPEHDADPARPVATAQRSRAGFVVSKAVGGAVVRNRVKRRLRHLMREQLGALPSGTDVVVRALPAAAGRSYAELGTDLARSIEAAARRPRRSGR